MLLICSTNGDCKTAGRLYFSIIDWTGNLLAVEAWKAVELSAQLSATHAAIYSFKEELIALQILLQYATTLSYFMNLSTSQPYIIILYSII